MISAVLVAEERGCNLQCLVSSSPDFGTYLKWVAKSLPNAACLP
jgi:hypothetical protein